MAFQRLRIRRVFLVGAGGAALAMGAAPAWGAPRGSDAQADACTTAYTNAQKSERASRLREAKDLFVTCAKSACGKFLQKECLTRYTRLESDIPTIVFHVAGDKGALPPDLQVRIDGTLSTSPLDEPVTLDPGVHEFAFSTADGMVNVSQKVMILQGDVRRPVAVSLRPLGDAPTGSSVPNPVPGKPEAPAQFAAPTALPFILGGVGVAGVGAGVAFLALEKHNTWNLAVDGLAIGAGALVGALWIFAHPAKKPLLRAAYTIDVTPTASGAIASLSGVF